MSKELKKKIKLLIKIIFIISAFIIIVNKIDINKLKEIKLIHPTLLILAFVTFNLSQIISAMRVHTYLKNINVTPTFKTQLILYYLGMFYNILLPGGIGGDAYKAYKFQKNFEVGYKKIIKALLIDRISGLFAIFFIISVLIFFSRFDMFIIYAIILLVISPFILYFIHKLLFIEFKKSFLKTFVFSLIIQSLQLISFIFIMLSFNIKLHLIDYGILFLISSVVSVIPISIGGVGLRELTFLYSSDYFPINAEVGILAAFLFFVITLISSSIGILFLRSKHV
ncbi:MULTISPECIES: lysylphosphatidylglycerol synthase transmembrane domain-containing protein [unclassified Lebetimonas]|uniref:lysylphosphatidylglycerol synthase transmembrane domain-containing protein n=1 Tax=unclassified Lebetimonas TaxID=2648158 RepID=UPI000463C513|nr:MULTISPECIES: lysylphosphatidylglycerol synthase transmembrane domain-containing protein [unclassified Lebetimonas]